LSTDVARPRPFFGPVTVVFLGLAVLGGAVFAWGALGADSGRAWRAFLQNWLLWAALAQGAIAFSCGIRLTNGHWAGPIHRIADSIGACAPITLGLYFVVWAGRHQLFEWVETPIAGKEWWYNESFLFTRDVMGLFWMVALTSVYLYMTVRPMLGAARESTGGWQGGLVQRWTAGWRGEETERSLAERRLRKLAAPMAMSFALVYSMLAVDMVMALSPHWVSTMFPAYYAWGGFLSAVALTTVIALLMRNTPELKGEVTESRRHDLGKMIFAFSIFWMYLFWSQYIVIWYGNIPEETSYIQARLGTQFLQDTWYMTDFWTRIAEPYVKITLSAWLCLWFIPFWVLLGAKPKKTPAILGTIATIVLIGFWIERFILVTPSIVPPEEVLRGTPITLVGLIEIGTSIGFIGLYGLGFLAFARGFPGAVAQRKGS
jgi:hypothetical protein